MRRLVFGKRARLDLADIYEFAVRDREGAATMSAYTKRVTRHCAALAANPALIGTVQEPNSSVRAIPHENLMIYVKYERRVLRVVRVLRAKRNREEIDLD